MEQSGLLIQTRARVQFQVQALGTILTVYTTLVKYLCLLCTALQQT